MPPVSLQLNCDLAEGAGVEARVMPFLDQANIACGAHAGSPALMRETLQLAKAHHVLAGAHPGYPDREHFGRRSLEWAPEEITQFIHDQLCVLQAIASELEIQLSHVKPHGALYHDMMQKPGVRAAVLRAMAEWPVPLMMQATSELDAHIAEARDHGVTLWFEAFADRQYTDEGRLLPRTELGAMLTAEAALGRCAN